MSTEGTPEPSPDAGVLPGYESTLLPAAEILPRLPPSAREVWSTLKTSGPLTHKDLLRRTRMPGRTVRYALSRLKEAGIVTARCNLMDCRQCYFYAADVCPGKEPFLKIRAL